MSSSLFRLYLICPLAWSLAGFASEKGSVEKHTAYLPSDVVGIIYDYYAGGADRMTGKTYSRATQNARQVLKNGESMSVSSSHYDNEREDFSQKIEIWEGDWVCPKEYFVLQVPKGINFETRMFHYEPGDDVLSKVYITTDDIEGPGVRYWMYNIAAYRSLKPILKALQWNKRGLISFEKSIESGQRKIGNQS